MEVIMFYLFTQRCLFIFTALRENRNVCQVLAYVYWIWGFFKIDVNMQ